MIHITDTALKKIQAISQSENKQDWSLRLGVKGGGCSGFTYLIDFIQSPKQGDQQFNLQGLNIVIDSKSLVFLAGTELDFTDGLNGSGFVFKNPNATRSCGCGSSFAV